MRNVLASKFCQWISFVMVINISYSHLFGSKKATAFFKTRSRVRSKYSLSKKRNSLSNNSQPHQIPLFIDNLKTSRPKLRLIKLRLPSLLDFLDAFCLQNIKNCSFLFFKAILAKNEACFTL